MRNSLTLSLAVLAGTVLAQTASPLKLVLDLDRVTMVQQDGKAVEKLVETTAGVQTGDLLVQEAAASNVSEKALRRVAINVPVPRNTEFAGRATPGRENLSLQYSFDGGKTFGAEPLKQVVEVTENGQKVKKEVVVPPSQYTNVRWTIATLNPDETLKLSFRVKVK